MGRKDEEQRRGEADCSGGQSSPSAVAQRGREYFLITNAGLKLENTGLFGINYVFKYYLYIFLRFKQQIQVGII
jgi:hypothetical protein